MAALEQQVIDYVVNHQDRLIELVRTLVRHPSENTPPTGSEGACQGWIASALRAAGVEPDLYELDTVAGLAEHALFVAGRDYRGRPNLGARRKGAGSGRSLLLSGHIDTVPQGSRAWTHAPFSGTIQGNRLYGRGANDMKAGVAINLFVLEALAALNLELSGDLIFETVVDEEFGGANGTLAGRLRGYLADAAVIAEPSFLRVCPAQRGGRTVHIVFEAPGGVLTDGAFPAGVVDQVTHFLVSVPKFADQRRSRSAPHPLYAHHPDPVPVSITKIHTAPWGAREPITTPEECRVEMYWQLIPGERQPDVESEFFAWFEQMLASAPHLFPRRPRVEFPIRWLPGSAIDAAEPVVGELVACAESVLGRRPPVAGIEGPCDLFLFHEFGIPAVLWGPCGGNTHATDEYVEIDSVVAAAKALLLFVCRWCGVEN
jgi:acetylornithine deacetylase